MFSWCEWGISRVINVGISFGWCRYASDHSSFPGNLEHEFAIGPLRDLVTHAGTQVVQ